MIYKRAFFSFLLLFAFLLPSHAQVRHLTFDDIELGIPLKACIKKCQQKGFKIHKQTTDDNIIYGDIIQVFMTGRYENEPAVIVLSGSHVTRTVFELEVYLREFIDFDEAAEKLTGIIQKEVSRFQGLVYFDDPRATGTSLVDLPSGKNHVTKTLMVEEWIGFGRICRTNSDLSNKMSYGTLSFKIYQSLLNHEHIIKVGYYDLSVGQMAESESNRKLNSTR